MHQNELNKVMDYMEIVDNSKGMGCKLKEFNSEIRTISKYTLKEVWSHKNSHTHHICVNYIAPIYGILGKRKYIAGRMLMYMSKALKIILYLITTLMWFTPRLFITYRDIFVNAEIGLFAVDILARGLVLSLCLIVVKLWIQDFESLCAWLYIKGFNKEVIEGVEKYLKYLNNENEELIQIENKNLEDINTYKLKVMKLESECKKLNCKKYREIKESLYRLVESLNCLIETVNKAPHKVAVAQSLFTLYLNEVSNIIKTIELLDEKGLAEFVETIEAYNKYCRKLDSDIIDEVKTDASISVKTLKNIFEEGVDNG